MAFIYDLADTWNDAGTTFKGIGLNVTDTASASDSLLMDLQVGGASKFSVSKEGYLSLPAGESGIRALSFDDTIGLYSLANALIVGNQGFGGRSIFSVENGSIGITRDTSLGWSEFQNGIAAAQVDLRLYRDAANTLGQRNGTNAQTFNLYNTYTDASNYERGFMRWNNNVLEIGTEAAGTGTLRDIRVGDGGGQPELFLSASEESGLKGRANRSLRIAADGSGFLELGAKLNNGAEDGAGVSIVHSVVTMANLPTSDPANAGQLWNDAGTLKISAG